MKRNKNFAERAHNGIIPLALSKHDLTVVHCLYDANVEFRPIPYVSIVSIIVVEMFEIKFTNPIDAKSPVSLQ